MLSVGGAQITPSRHKCCSIRAPCDTGARREAVAVAVAAAATASSTAVIVMQYCLGCDSERLFAACKHGDADRVRMLLEQGAEPSSEMRSSEHLASPDKTPLLLSVMQGHADCVQLLIDAGALLDVQCGPDLETSLHVCCARGKPDLAQQLITGGANLCKPDAIGRHAAQRVEP